MKNIIIAALLLISSAISAQESTDNLMTKAEQMFEFVKANQADSLYANMSDQVKSMVEPTMFDGILNQIEAQAGKYKSHSAWEKQEIMGQDCYVSTVEFEQSQLGLLIIFDKKAMMLGIQFVPVEAIKKG